MPKPEDRANHPAPFSEAVMQVVESQLPKAVPPPARVLDPFAGIGRVHGLQKLGYDTYGIEIEPEWAAAHKDTQEGDARALPFLDGTMHAVVTSPTYGNRMADHHRAKDGSKRTSYTHNIRELTDDPERELADGNTGKLYAWNADYWQLHEGAYAEVDRVLADDGIVVLNTSDFIRKGQVIRVTGGHHALFGQMGYRLVAAFKVPTPRMGFGANGSARVQFEDVAILAK